jgi:hypothetical protein
MADRRDPYRDRGRSRPKREGDHEDSPDSENKRFRGPQHHQSQSQQSRSSIEQYSANRSYDEGRRNTHGGYNVPPSGNYYQNRSFDQRSSEFGHRGHGNGRGDYQGHYNRDSREGNQGNYNREGNQGDNPRQNYNRQNNDDQIDSNFDFNHI